MKNGSQKPKSNHADSARGRLGRYGEELAAAFFLAKGFEIVDRNWRSRVGEIDLVVRRGHELRFVEVKTRRSHVFGFPEGAVTPTKLQHLAGAMELWLRGHHCTSASYQVDVLAISLLPTQESPHIEWIQGV